MPSVDVSWNGKCLDHQIQKELCEKIAQLGALSNEFYKEYLKEEVHSTLYNAGELIKDVLISTKILEYQSVSPELIQDNKVKFFTKDICLYGIDFPLYDIRNNNSYFPHYTDNKISFVFVRSNVPGLDGQLEEVCHLKPDEEHPSGQLALISPVVDLRYYLEGWMKRFLGWVKHFFIPDLFYWAWCDFPGYKRYLDYDPQDRKTADTIFLKLLDEFAAEAKSFTEYIYRLEEEEDEEESTN